MTHEAVSLAAVDALARLQLAARRLGLDLRLVSCDPELESLLLLTGLDGVLEPVALSALEVRREAEPGEQPGVEEVVEVGDPPA